MLKMIASVCVFRKIAASIDTNPRKAGRDQAERSNRMGIMPSTRISFNRVAIVVFEMWFIKEIIFTA